MYLKDNISHQVLPNTVEQNLKSWKMRANSVKDALGKNLKMKNLETIKYGQKHLTNRYMCNRYNG